jgi:hypothetical protein
MRSVTNLIADIVEVILLELDGILALVITETYTIALYIDK